MVLMKNIIPNQITNTHHRQKHQTNKSGEIKFMKFWPVHGLKDNLKLAIKYNKCQHNNTFRL